MYFGTKKNTHTKWKLRALYCFILINNLTFAALNIEYISIFPQMKKTCGDSHDGK